nr:uncharacterized protein LOC109189720 [Ipomoea batatas]
MFVCLFIFQASRKLSEKVYVSIIKMSVNCSIYLGTLMDKKNDSAVPIMMLVC